MKLNKYLEASPVFAINAAYEKLVAKVNSDLRKEDLNLLQGLVITALFFEDSTALTPSQLATNLKTTRSNISHIISSLEYKKLIQRSVSPHDARQFVLSLKPEGKKKALSLIKYFDKLQSHFEDHLGKNHCKSMTVGIHELIASYEV